MGILQLPFSCKVTATLMHWDSPSSNSPLSSSS